MWRNGRRKGLKIPRGGPVPVRVRSQAPLTEVSPFWRKYMRPLLCLIFFRSFGSLPPPCCDRTVRNSDAHALCRHHDKASPIGVRYSGRSRGLSQMRQVVPYRRSLFRRSAMNCLSPYASLFTSCVNCIRSLRSGHKHQRFKLGLKRSENGSLAQVPLPFFGSPYAIAFRSVYVTGERNSDAIAPRYSRISPSPIGNRYSVATLRFAPYGPVTSTSASSSA